MAFLNVVEAHVSVWKIAKKAHLDRESLYKTLPDKGDPELSTFISLILI